MKNILVLFLIMASSVSYGQTNKEVLGAIFPNASPVKNYIINSNAEHGIVNGITKSASIVTRNTTTPLFDKADFQIDATTTGQTIKWTASTSDPGASSSVCEAYYWIKGDGTLYKTYVENSSSAKLSSELVLGNYAAAQLISIPYSCTNGARVVIESTGNGAAINVDNVNIGLLVHGGLVGPQAQSVGSLVTTGCGSTWSSTSSTFADFSVVTGCTYTVSGSVAAPSTMIPGVTVANVLPGDYYIEYAGSAGLSGSGSGDGYFTFNDGTTNAAGINVIGRTSAGVAIDSPVIVGKFSYTTAQSNVTFRLRARNSSNSANDTVYLTSDTNRPGTITVRYYPTAAQQAAISPSTVPGVWSGYHIATTDWTTTSTSFADFGSGSGISLTQLQASNMTCVTAGSSLPGITCTPSASGLYSVEMNANFYSATSTQSTSLRLVDGSGNALGASIGSQVTGNAFQQTGTLKALINATAGQAFTVKVQGATSSGASASHLYAPSTAASLGWTVVPATGSLPVPILLGSVTSNANGALKFEAALVNNHSGSQSVVSQTSSWLTINTCAGTGSCSYTMSGFSSKPYCVCTPALGAASMCASPAQSATSVLINTYAGASSPVNEDGVSLLCFGPR